MTDGIKQWRKFYGGLLKVPRLVKINVYLLEAGRDKSGWEQIRSYLTIKILHYIL